MVRTTFNRLRAVKDSLPHGSMDAIAAELEVSGDEVRAYFNGEGNADYHLPSFPYVPHKGEGRKAGYLLQGLQQDNRRQDKGRTKRHPQGEVHRAYRCR